jgi:hypothetical protein
MSPGEEAARPDTAAAGPSYVEYPRQDIQREPWRTIRAFAGDDIDAAVLYPEDERYLVGGKSTVTRYRVVDQVEAPPVRRGGIAFHLGTPART